MICMCLLATFIANSITIVMASLERLLVIIIKEMNSPALYTQMDTTLKKRIEKSCFASSVCYRYFSFRNYRCGLRFIKRAPLPTLMFDAYPNLRNQECI